ncbi:hypothetical protein WK59_12080 [Burkholderia ubonensis]|nr:hypothetical protein WK59_12080 [Burkholderia ubonensis]
MIQEIVDGIGEQIRDLDPAIEDRVSLDAVVTELTNLQLLVQSEADAVKTLAATALTTTQAIQSGLADGSKGLVDLGPVLGNVETLLPLLDESRNATAKALLTSVIARITKLLHIRPDVDAILGDLEAIKSLRGGPADATAFHDFHVLQLAFKNVWIHAFDESIRAAAEEAYKHAVQLYADAGLTIPDTGTVDDIEQLDEFLNALRGAAADIAPPIPDAVTNWFPVTIVPVWPELSDGQRSIATQDALLVQNYSDHGQLFSLPVKAIYDAMEQMAAKPEGPGGKLSKLLAELGDAMSEPYAFDVFAPNSFNYGILLTYRQEWTPGEYQAGDLRSTIPLAPGETRKYSKRTAVKKTRAQKEVEKSVSTSTLQTSTTQRAESDIMQKTDTATNFKMTTEGSFNIGIGDIKSTTEFGANQTTDSVNNKKEFRELTVKAAQEYRLERNLEIDTTSSIETEQTESGEISNPNTEITVTYLFYELQRRYKINEYLYRVRPVILIAQEVPSPHEVDEAWLIENQWIVARVLLDESLRPALDYLSSGLAGDEASIAVLRAQWENLRTITSNLEAQLNDQINIRNYYRDQVASDTYREDLAKAVDNNVGFFGKIAEDSFGNFTGAAVDNIEANRKYTESLLQNINDNIADLQNKLKQSNDSYQAATARYSDAMQKQYSRTVAIDQLRVHVKQNILFYMQAIWAHEPPDQRFFRLYNKQVFCPAPAAPCVINITSTRGADARFAVTANIWTCPPVVDQTMVDLVEIADIDNPLGFKGNYIIFPLKDRCYLTTYMLQDFIDEQYGLKDPDIFATWKAMGSIDAVAASVAEQLKTLVKGSPDWQTLMNEFADFVNETQGQVDEIIIPTGQLFIEALPGSHPLLEDFKLLHRAEDVRKVKAEVRHAELENLRLAARMTAAESDPKNLRFLADPEIDKKVIIHGDNNTGVNVDEG